MTPDPTVDETDAPSQQTAASVRTDGGEAKEVEEAEETEESEESEATDSEADADDQSEADDSEASDEESGESEASDEESDESEDSADEESEDSAAEEPATVEADDEAVAEQTGDVGVEPQIEEGDAEESDQQESDQEDDSPSLDGGGDTASIIQVRNQVIELSTDVIGRGLDGIIEVSRTDDNWRAVVEIIERRSVPDTQDILGQYEIELDEGGEVIGYRRLEKYRRSDTGPNEH